MQQLWKITIYGYLIIAAFLFYLAFEKWNTDPQKAYLTLGIAVLAVVMFFIKRRFRNKVMQRQNQNNKK